MDKPIIMTKEHRQLLQIFKNHVGKINARTGAKLCEEYHNYFKEPMSRRELRKLKFELNTEFKQFICSDSSGYYIAKGYDEILELEKYLYSWIENLAHEVKIVKSNFINTNINQQQDLPLLDNTTGGARMK